MAKPAFESIAAALRDAAGACPGKTAVITRADGEVSYAELDARVDRMAARLAAAGVATGDRVAVVSRNSLSVIDLLYGVARAGAIFVPINWRLAPPEIAFILEDATPKLVFVEEALVDLVARQAGPQTIAIRDDGTFADLPEPAGDHASPSVGRRDAAMLVYTSGTTGHPKAAILTHGSFVRHWGLDSADLPAHVRIAADDLMVLAHPLFHIGTIEPVFRLMFNRGAIVLHHDFDAGAILEDAERHRATLLALVPTALQMVLRHPACAAADLSSVRQIFYGASPIPAPLLLEALERFDAAFVQAYGMTEIGGTCVMLAPEDHVVGSPRLRAAGRPVLGAEAKVIGPDGATLAAGSTGEIAVRGSGMMAGYWNRPEATAEAIDAGGWLHTGDAGMIDDGGYVYVQDRVKDMIISGGENIYPAEVESAVFSHPAVEEVVVIGVPDARWGEAVKALVVPRAGATIDEADVIAWARERIAGYKVPKSVETVDALPKSAAGKILRRVARAPYWIGHERQLN